MRAVYCSEAMPESSAQSVLTLLIFQPGCCPTAAPRLFRVSGLPIQPLVETPECHRSLQAQPIHSRFLAGLNIVGALVCAVKGINTLHMTKLKLSAQNENDYN